MGVSDQVMLAGFEAGFAESHFDNLDGGDLDSEGVLQQRSSQGWKGLQNVELAFREFYERAKGVDQNEPAHIIAQKVQRSHCTKSAPNNADCKGREGGNYLDEEEKAQKKIDELRAKSTPSQNG